MQRREWSCNRTPLPTPGRQHNHGTGAGPKRCSGLQWALMGPGFSGGRMNLERKHSLAPRTAGPWKTAQSLVSLCLCLSPHLFTPTPREDSFRALSQGQTQRARQDPELPSRTTLLSLAPGCWRFTPSISLPASVSSSLKWG